MHTRSRKRNGIFREKRVTFCNNPSIAGVERSQSRPYTHAHMYRPTLRAPPSHSLSRVTVSIRVRVRVSIRTRTQKQRDGTVRSRQREKKMVGVGVVVVGGGGIFCTHLLLLSMVYILLCVFLPVRHKTYSLACTRSLACQHSREAVGYSRRRRRRRRRRRERKRKGSRLLATWKACFSKTT